MFLLVEYTVCICGAGAHAEEVAVYSGGIIVHVVELWTCFVPARDHCAHAQTISPVLIPDIHTFTHVNTTYIHIQYTHIGWSATSNIITTCISFEDLEDFTYIVFASSLDAAATDILSLLRSS